MTWCINEFLTDSISKLDRRDKVAYAKTKAHCDLDLLVLREGEWWRGYRTYANKACCGPKERPKRLKRHLLKAVSQGTWIVPNIAAEGPAASATVLNPFRGVTEYGGANRKVPTLYPATHPFQILGHVELPSAPLQVP